MALSKDYKDLSKFLDTTDDYENDATEFVIGDTRYVLVTQVSELDAGQSLFEYTDEGWEPLDSDTIIDPVSRSTGRALTAELVCSAVGPEKHSAVHVHSADQVDKFSSSKGPSGGRLACVWAVRHLVKQVLGYWITRTDGTAVLDPQLRQCFGATHQEADVPAGGIIISPTEGRSPNRNVGHVSLLGPYTGDGSRLIYSNSSGKARWKQNFTLDSWIRRYRDKKGLKVRFYPLPYRGESLIS